MKLFAALIVALFGLATASPRARPPLEGPCEVPNKICTEKNILEHSLVKGNRMLCDLMLDEPQKPYVHCTVNEGEEKDGLSEICNKNGGCIECELLPGGNRIQKRIGGQAAEVFCELADKATADNALSHEQLREQLEQKVQEVCKAKKLDQHTCNTTKYDCINVATPGSTPDQIAQCVEKKA